MADIMIETKWNPVDLHIRFVGDDASIKEVHQCDSTRREVGKTPEILFKYYSQDGIGKVLATNTFKWALPCDENDPFEALANGWDVDSIKEALPNASAQQIDMADNIFKMHQIQKRVSHVAAYISFSEKCDDVLMWAHYAGNHTGVCVEFDVTAFGELLTYFSKVTYAEKYRAERKRMPRLVDDCSEEGLKSTKEFLSYKAKEWEYENEWRLIVPPMAPLMHQQRLDTGEYILVTKIPDGAIKRLIFGHKMPISTRLALAKMVKKNHRACSFAEVNPNRTKFQLEVDSLDIDPIVVKS